MIDAHCHLEYIEDVEDVLHDAKKAGMSAIVTSIADIKDKDFLEMHRKHPSFVFVCLGFHPEIMDKYGASEIDDYINFIKKNKDDISAIGEVGLDYTWVTKADDQLLSKNIFEKFIALAKELQLPLVIHSRNGKDNKEGSDDGVGDAIDILIKNNCKDVMMHCFSGSETQLKTCIAQGWLISFATLITRSFKHQRLAKVTPIEQMLLETDAPWLDPDSHPGSSQLTNRPWKIERSADIIANIKNIDKDEVLRQTEKNARRFFRI